MKIVLVVFLLLHSVLAFSNKLKGFNQALVEDVQIDIKNQNDEQFKVRGEVSRGPASVSPVQEEPPRKIDKLRQTGSPW